MEAIGLLQEWVQDIGSQAGLIANNTTILSGAVGAPESRLEAGYIALCMINSHSSRLDTAKASSASCTAVRAREPECSAGSN